MKVCGTKYAVNIHMLVRIVLCAGEVRKRRRILELMTAEEPNPLDYAERFVASTK